MKHTQHFIRLERCLTCEALQYLAVRSRVKSLEIVLIHQLGTKRNLRVVTSFKKSTLEFHQPGNRGSKEGDIVVRFDRRSYEGLQALVTRLKRSTFDIKPRQERGKESSERKGERATSGEQTLSHRESF